MTRASRYDQITTQSAVEKNGRSDRFVELSKHGDDKTIIATFSTPDKANQQQKIDLGFLRQIPNLSQALAQGFVLQARRLAPVTRTVSALALRTGFVEFLIRQNNQRIKLDGITTDLLEQFRDWIARLEDGALVWGKGTQKNKYRAITKVLRLLQKNSHWKEKLNKNLRIPVLADPKGDYTPTPVLTDEIWSKIYLAAVEEVVQWHRDRLHFKKECELAHAKYRAFIESGSRTDRPPFNGNDALTLGALVDLLEDGMMPTRESFEKKAPSLFKVMYPNEGRATPFVQKFAHFFAPGSARKLVPYILLYGMYFTYNNSTLREAKISDFKRISVIGADRFWAKPRKERARRRQDRTCAISNDPENPSVMYDLLVEWTARIRASAPPWCKNHLFIFSNISFDGSEENIRTISGPNLQVAINGFCKDHELPSFNMKQIRPTSLDQIRTLFDGDIRPAQRAANHRRVDTTHAFYTSDAEQQRNWERLGGGIALRNRWITTDGLIDPRGAADSGQDAGSATPGWSCLDPFASPLPGQTLGRLCSEYGGCPACPLAQVNASSVYSAKRLLQLIDLIHDAQASVPAVRWMTVWAPRLRKLNAYWIPKFSKEVIEEAQRTPLAPMAALD